MDNSEEFGLPSPVPTPGNGDDEDPPGGWWSDAWSSIGDFWDSIGDFLGEKFGFLVSPLESIGNALSSFADGLLEIKDNISNFFSNFWSGLVGIFVPSDGYLDGKIEETKTIINDKFAGVIEMKNNIINSISQIKNEEFEGVKIDLSSFFIPGLGEYYILEPGPVNMYSNKVKPWISGLMIFLTGTYFLRKIISVIRGVRPL